MDTQQIAEWKKQQKLLQQQADALKAKRKPVLANQKQLEADALGRKIKEAGGDDG